MFPWNWFDPKHGMDPRNFDETSFQKLMEQFSKQMMPNYLQNLFHHHKSQNSHQMYNHEQNSLNESVFETHDYIFIRIPIPDENIVRGIKITYSLNKCTIEGIYSDAPYTIVLPAAVKRKGATAIYRDQILEIRLLKSTDWQVGEIKIDEL